MVDDSCGHPVGRQEGYSTGRIDLEPLESLEPAVGFLSANWTSHLKLEQEQGLIFPLRLKVEL